MSDVPFAVVVCQEDPPEQIMLTAIDVGISRGLSAVTNKKQQGRGLNFPRPRPCCFFFVIVERPLLIPRSIANNIINCSGQDVVDEALKHLASIKAIVTLDPSRHPVEKMRSVHILCSIFHEQLCHYHAGIKCQDPYPYPWSMALHGPLPQQPDRWDEDELTVWPPGGQ